MVSKTDMKASPLQVYKNQIIIQLYNDRTPALDDKEEKSGVFILFLRANLLPSNMLWTVLLMFPLVCQCK